MSDKDIQQLKKVIAQLTKLKRYKRNSTRQGYERVIKELINIMNEK